MPRALIVEIFGDARQFAKEMDKAAGKTKKFGKAAGVAGAALGGVFVLGAEKAIKGAMEDQVQMSRLTKAFQNAHVPIKGYTKQIEAAQESGRKLGFVDEDVVASLGSLITATKSTKKSFELLGVAQDLSRFKHIDLESATKKLTSAMAGNVRAAKELGIRIPKDLTDPQKKAAFVIEEVRKRVHGQAAAFAGTAEGGIAKYKARMDEVRDSIGTGLLPAFQFLVEKMAKVAEFFAKHKTLAKVLFVAIGVLSGALLILAASTWAVNTAMAANPIGLVVLAIAALIAAIVIAVKHWDDIKAAMSDVWDWIKGTFLGIWDDVTNALQGVKDWVTNNWPEIATLLSGPFALILAPATNAFGIRDKLVAAFEFVKKEVKRIFDDVVTFFTELPGRIWDGFQKGWEATKTNLGGAFNWVKDHASDVVDQAANFFKALPGKIGDAIGGAMHFLKEKIEELFSPKKIVEWIEHALGFSEHSEFFGKIGMKIVRSIATGAMGAANLLKDAVVELATGLFGSLGSAQGGGVSGKGGTGVGKDGSTLPLLMSWAKQEGIGITSTTSGNHVKGSYHYQGRAIDVAGSGSQMAKFFLDTIKRFGVGRITELFYDPMGYYIDNGRAVRGAIGGHRDHVHLALGAGGIVTRPTMALIGEKGPEAVIPLIHGGIGGDTVIHNVIQLDGKAVYESWKKHAARDVKRNGGTGIRS